LVTVRRRAIQPSLLEVLMGGVLLTVVEAGSPIHLPGNSKACKTCEPLQLDGPTVAFPSTDFIGVTMAVCRVEEAVGGQVLLKRHDDSICEWVMPNPPLHQAVLDPHTSLRLAPANATIAPVAGVAGAIVVAEMRVNCSLPSGSETVVFLEFSGTVYRHDPRLRLGVNDLGGSRGTGTGTGAGADQNVNPVCGVGPKTFISEAHCVWAPSCEPTILPIELTLSDDAIRSFYRIGRRYVYYVTGLRLTAPFDVSPCQGGVRSRWARAPELCAQAPLVTNHASRDAIERAISQAVATEGSSPDIVDIEGACSDRRHAAVGARVSVGGTCWRHVHPDHWSVYDFTLWVARNREGPEPILRLAEAGSPNMHFSHTDMRRWLNHKAHLLPLGVRGEVKVYTDLPLSVQSHAHAASIGALQPAAPLVEVCGSPGEVSNNPALGHRFRSWIGFEEDGSAELDQPVGPSEAKRSIYHSVALDAADQLRHRAAWALSQVYVTSELMLDNRAMAQEMWLTYHDIFVRHAFGNLRDLLREVSYSPVMGEFLTLLGSRSLVFNKPDENFAREIMQLFTIGLYQLNPDGTAERSPRGALMSTYELPEIASFARAWTGFTRAEPRSNIESDQDGGAPPSGPRRSC